MIYGTELDYAQLERDAWQRGDHSQADAYARALEASELETEKDEAVYKVERIQELITQANWRTGKKAELRELVEQIRDEVNAR